MKAGLGRAPWLTTLIAAAVLALALPLWLARWREEQLLNPALLTGWWLFVVLLLLGAFNARKKLAVVPLGLAATWLRWHVVGGFLTLALFWLHTGNLWPTGLYEQALAGAFYPQPDRPPRVAHAADVSTPAGEHRRRDHLRAHPRRTGPAAHGSRGGGAGQQPGDRQ
jgi:hypothetical protein